MIPHREPSIDIALLRVGAVEDEPAPLAEQPLPVLPAGIEMRLRRNYGDSGITVTVY